MAYCCVGFPTLIFHALIRSMLSKSGWGITAQNIPLYWQVGARTVLEGLGLEVFSHRTDKIDHLQMCYLKINQIFTHRQEKLCKIFMV